MTVLAQDYVGICVGVTLSGLVTEVSVFDGSESDTLSKDIVLWISSSPTVKVLIVVQRMHYGPTCGVSKFKSKSVASQSAACIARSWQLT